MNSFQHLFIAITHRCCDHFDKASDAVDVIFTDRMLETWKVNEEAVARDAKRAKSLEALVLTPWILHKERLRAVRQRLPFSAQMARVWHLSPTATGGGPSSEVYPCMKDTFVAS
ncbi:hypothetical protein HPB47_026345 [Ixodes persulcatus]|uniref:Uncharacterized protein n=1 Tax=Ixodes persulcatus TaxID=34615 RepID=A0AC60PZB7_IXOPE|nr:hypothetical protein HPB47_026345 [Ixodes persulcatus]